MTDVPHGENIVTTTRYDAVNDCWWVQCLYRLEVGPFRLTSQTIAARTS